MYSILLVIHVLLTLTLIVVILIQRSSNDGFGMGSGSGGNLMTGRASANMLTRITAITAALFIANSLALGILTQGERRSITDDVMQLEQQVQGSAEPAADTDDDEKENKAEDKNNSGDMADDADNNTGDISVPKPGME